MGLFYHTTKVYGYIKKAEAAYSYYFLLGLLNSNLFWFFIKATGYVLRGGYYAFKTNYIMPFPIPHREDIKDSDYSTIEDATKYILERGKTLTPSQRTKILAKINEAVCRIYEVTPSTIY